MDESPKLNEHAYCIVCDTKLAIEKPDDVKQVMGGMFISVDLDAGSRFFKQSASGWINKLRDCNHITGVLCDNCFEKKSKHLYGTKIEVKRTYQDIHAEENN